MTIIEIESAIKRFEYYKELGEKTFSQLNEDDLFWTYNEESNSIATIVAHLTGNMLSRWTDFLSSDGEKSWRNRDDEFEKMLNSKEEILSRWQEGWTCLFTALRNLTTADLDTKVYIRSEKHSISDAIQRQLAHYPYHIGQIVFIGKMRTNMNWKSLFIPKGTSELYNLQKVNKKS